MGLFADKIFLLNISNNVAADNLKLKLMQGGTRAVFHNDQELDEIARNAITEFRVNIQGVKD
jgi:hypothetical protein